jgi:hypothetical protein
MDVDDYTGIDRDHEDSDVKVHADTLELQCGGSHKENAPQQSADVGPGALDQGTKSGYWNLNNRGSEVRQICGQHIR